MITATPARRPPDRQVRKRAHHQEGYALLIILFLVALLGIAITTATLNVVTNTRREKEQEMIWRGRQYIRGIRLYYGKLHHFPTALDDLYKPKTGLRFMRQAYKDPMNTEDGSWRLIYVGPNGQLIGSLRPPSMNMTTTAGGFGNPIGMGSAGSPTSSSGFFGSSNGFGSASSFGGGSNSSSSFGGNSGFGSSNQANGQNTSANGSTPGQPGTNANGQPIGGGDPNDPNDPNNPNNDSLIPKSLEGQVIGGNIIGVGSKINRKSIIWYEKAKNYRQFEFIWDPSVDALTGQRPGMPGSTTGNPFATPGTGTGTSPFGTPGAPGSSPFGTSPNPNSGVPGSGTPGSGAPGANPPYGPSNPNPNPNPAPVTPPPVDPNNPNSPPDTPLQAPPSQ